MITVSAPDEVVYITTVDEDEVQISTTPNNIWNPAIQFQDEGANVGTPGAVSTMNFVGANVSLGLVNGKLTVTISSSSGGGTWGSITGTITNQTDLIALLANYLTISAAAAGYQPLDSDLTAIAALATTSWGRSLLTLASAQATIDAISQMTTLGDTVYGGASGTQTRLAGNTASWRKKKVQTGTGSVSAAPAWVNDTILITLSNGNQTTTSSSATAITELVTPTLEANCRYAFSGNIDHLCSGTGGVKFAVDVPTGATLRMWFFGRSSSATAFVQIIAVTDATLVSTALCSFAGGSSGAYIMGEVQLSSTTGTVQFMFASGTASETSTINQTGTFIRVEKITP